MILDVNNLCESYRSYPYWEWTDGRCIFIKTSFWKGIYYFGGTYDGRLLSSSLIIWVDVTNDIPYYSVLSVQLPQSVQQFSMVYIEEETKIFILGGNFYYSESPEKPIFYLNTIYSTNSLETSSPTTIPTQFPTLYPNNPTSTPSKKKAITSIIKVFITECGDR